MKWIVVVAVPVFLAFGQESQTCTSVDIQTGISTVLLQRSSPVRAASERSVNVDAEFLETRVTTLAELIVTDLDGSQVKVPAGGVTSIRSRIAMSMVIAFLSCLFLQLMGEVRLGKNKTGTSIHNSIEIVCLSRNFWYGSMAFVLMFIALVGFAPGSVVALTSGNWYADAFVQGNRPSVVEAINRFGSRWKLVLWVHVVIAIGWLVLAAAKVATGLSHRVGHSQDRWWHKKAGYGVALLGMLAMVLGASLELHKRLDGARGEGYFAFGSVMMSAFIVVVNLSLGIHYIRIKDIRSHKVAMSLACAWSANAGSLRFFAYVLSRTTGRSSLDTGINCGAQFMFMGLMLGFLFSASLSGGDHICNLIIANVFIVVVSFVHMAVTLLKAYGSVVLAPMLAWAFCVAILMHWNSRTTITGEPRLEEFDAATDETLSSEAVAQSATEEASKGLQKDPASEHREVELIASPALISAFHALVGWPARCTLALAVLFALSCALATDYTRLKNKPLHLEPFGTRLKDVQLKVQHDFGSDPAGSMHALVLMWCDDCTTLSSNLALDRAMTANDKIEAALRRLSKHQPSCSSLTWQSYSEHADLNRKLFVARSRDHQSLAPERGIVMRMTLNATTGFGQSNPCISSVRKAVGEVNEKTDGLNVVMASANAVLDASFQQSDQSTLLHLAMSAPIMMLLLMLGVGSLARAITPFLCLAASIAGFRAMLVVVKWCWDDFNFAGPDTSIVFILLALCFDYGLFFWARFSEERRKNPSEGAYTQAIMTTLKTSGYAIFLSMVVLLVTFFINALYPEHNKSGYLGTSFQLISGVVFVGFYSLTIPAVLAAQFPSQFDTKDEDDGWRGLQRARSMVSRSVMERPRWTELCGHFVTRKPWNCVVPLFVFICFAPLVITLRSAKLNFDTYGVFASKTVPEFSAHAIYEARFSAGRSTPAFVLLEAIPIDDATKSVKAGKSVVLTKQFRKVSCDFVRLVLDETRGMKYEIKSADVRSIWWDPARGACAVKPLLTAGASISSDGREELMQLQMRVNDTSEAAQSMTRRFWKVIEPKANWTFHAGGATYALKASLDTPLAEEMLMEQVYHRHLPWNMFLTVVVVSSIIGYCFSSVFVAFKLVFTVVVPILAEYGMLVGVYQYGWLTWLGIDATNGIRWTLMYNTAGFLFALAIDYDIFLFARVYERRLEGYDNRSAVRVALNETGPVITLAGSLMIIAFFFIFLSSLPLVSQIGFLYCFGVAVDTFIIRMWIAPAVLCIYEPLNFWPKKMPPITKTYFARPS
eukprot:TRINITY_DN12986_c0_g3_i2.p1 TRINITY_DN12986_c0_g3~~TRINITY_DN12986_c0_g3_i2.p1  ORF type:complete len:1278 (+),score=174.03 TRINITY_DN12986_c0_g3_i2:73-3906(+)